MWLLFHRCGVTLMLLIIAINLLSGLTFTIGKILVQLADPMVVAGLRMFAAGIVLGAYVFFFVKVRLTLDRQNIKLLAQIVVIGTFLSYFLCFWSLQFVTAIKSALIYNMAPFITVLLSYLFLKTEVMTVRKWIGLVVGMSGVIPLLVAKEVASEHSLHSFSFFSWPECAMLMSVVCFSYGWIVVKKLIKRNSGLSPVVINCINMLGAGLLALGVSWGVKASFSIQQPLQFWLWVALIIVFTNVVYYNLYALLLKRRSVVLMSLASLFAPISAAFSSWLYFGEKVTWDVFVSGGLVLVGFVFFYVEENKINKEKAIKAL